jgi:hypothetical protein
MPWATASGFMIGFIVQLYVTALINQGYLIELPWVMALGDCTGPNLDCFCERFL